MTIVRSRRKPAFFQPVSVGFLTLRILIAAIVAAALGVYGLSAPAFAAPASTGSGPLASSSVRAPALAPMQSTPSVQAGVFVPVQGRAVDTRSGLGGITGPVAAGTWYPFQILGQAGVPATGVATVLVNLTIVGGTAPNAAQLVPNSGRHHETTVLFSGAGDTISNSAAIAVGSDGKLALYSSTSQQFIVDVQGYYTSGSTPAPGGFVSVPTSRVIDTRDGTGFPAGAWTGTAVKSVTLKSKGGVPDTAGAVFANITVISTDASNPVFATLPGDGFAQGGNPGTSINFRGNQTTAIGAVLQMNAAGVVDIKHYMSVTPGVNVLIDIQGYFDGQVSTSSFTTVESRIYDSRVAPNTAIPANTTVEVQIGGVGGLPAASPNVAGVMMNITPLSTGFG
ncbi:MULTISPECIES: hypothetical protein [Arthrobacter]|uniref:Uncharacterized protein n=1 Tax=Arthrobacter terricola TaxID=2547396 RepID=A0A4R5K6U7_9MICC|nr:MULTISPECIES: hypothetical protein [Arthrobacter]MBT8161712.1 hypothetical protein [Arthrobacter sp. GN70]TDF89396.1 hypothetical protein E1809_23040 [Arthrobacter terricola]